MAYSGNGKKSRDCRTPVTTRISPAMASGLEKYVWELDELLAAI
jgi:hypothetical protein